MAVVTMEDMATTMARDLPMLNLKLILMLTLVFFMEVMVDMDMAMVSMEDMADMVLATAVATSVVMEDMV